MVKRSTRRQKSGLRLFQRAYSPVYHLLEATRNVGKSAFAHSSKVVDNVLGFGQNTGIAVTRGLNRSINGVVRGTRRKSRSKSKTKSKTKSKSKSKSRK
jgi:hypothetical protein